MADSNYSAAGSSEISLKGEENNKEGKKPLCRRRGCVGLTGSHLPLRLHVMGKIPFNLSRKEWFKKPFLPCQSYRISHLLPVFFSSLLLHPPPTLWYTSLQSVVVRQLNLVARRHFFQKTISWHFACQHESAFCAHGWVGGETISSEQFLDYFHSAFANVCGGCPSFWVLPAWIFTVLSYFGPSPALC